MISFIFVLILVLLDQLSKKLVSSNMLLNQSIKIIPNFFSITYVRNIGAGFSILEGKRTFFLVLTILAILFFSYLYYKTPKSKRLDRILLLVIIAGSIGNFIDRLLYGSVVDFLDFKIFGYDFPIFNLADCYLTIGILIYIILSFNGERNA